MTDTEAIYADGLAAETPGREWRDILLARPDIRDELQGQDEISEGMTQASLVVIEAYRAEAKDWELRADTIAIHSEKTPKTIDTKQVIENYFYECFWWSGWETTGDEEGLITKDPLADEVTQTFAIGTDRPEVLAYNTAEPLRAEHVSAIHRTYEWFYEQAGNAVFDEAPFLFVGRHVGIDRDKAIGNPRYDHHQILGLNHANTLGSSSVISMSSHAFMDEETAQRYQPLLDRGITLPEIVLTHELMHALSEPDIDKSTEPDSVFARLVGWETHAYEYGPKDDRKQHLIRGLGTVATSESHLPVTEYGEHAPWEDLAEAGVFYRFAPELLDETRTKYIHELLESHKKYSTAEESRQAPVQIQELEAPVYPYHPIPSRIIGILHVEKETRRERKIRERYEWMMARQKAFNYLLGAVKQFQI